MKTRFLRAAIRLEGCDVYASCEPRPMCLAGIYGARIGKIFHAGSGGFCRRFNPPGNGASLVPAPDSDASNFARRSAQGLCGLAGETRQNSLLKIVLRRPGPPAEFASIACFHLLDNSL